MGDWLEEGESAPDFTLAADDGKKVKLKDLRGQPVVLYFRFVSSICGRISLVVW